MTANVSMAHTTHTVNGHRCEGWAGGNNALEVPDITLAETEVGADGLLVTASNGMRGGVVTYRFLANSRSRAQFGKWLAQIQKGAAIAFEASSSNSQTGETTRFSRGVMVQGPTGTTMGNAVPPPREFQIYYESIITNFDGFKSQAAPVLAAA